MEAPIGPDIVARYAQVFADHDTPYIVVGAFAVVPHGLPRFSSDLEIAVNIRFDPRETVRGPLKAQGCRSFEEHQDPPWGQRLACLTEEDITLETFFAPKNPVSEREFSRAVTTDVEENAVQLVSPEDLVLRKPVNTWLRRGVGFDDAVGVLARNWTTFDRDHVRAHCGPDRVCGLFGKAVEEARPFAEGAGDA